MFYSSTHTSKKLGFLIFSLCTSYFFQNDPILQPVYYNRIPVSTPYLSLSLARVHDLTFILLTRTQLPPYTFGATTTIFSTFCPNLHFSPSITLMLYHISKNLKPLRSSLEFIEDFPVLLILINFYLAFVVIFWINQSSWWEESEKFKNVHIRRQKY